MTYALRTLLAISSMLVLTLSALHAQNYETELVERPGNTRFANPYPTKGSAALVRVLQMREERAAQEAAEARQSVQQIPAQQVPNFNYENDLYRVKKEWLKGTTVGDIYLFRITLVAKQNLYNVRVIDVHDTSLQYRTSKPEGNPSSDMVSWLFQQMAAGQQLVIDVSFDATQEGEFINQVVVSTDTAFEIAYKVGMPRLELTLDGPRMAELGQDVTWNARVSNVGTSEAKDVVVTDQLPSGFSGSNLERIIGTLEPGTYRDLTFTARSTREGDFTNTAVATSRNIPQGVSASADISVVQSRVSLALEGTPRSYVFARAKYNLTVTNEGSTTLNQIAVNHTLPNFTELVSADGAQINDRLLIWQIPSLEPGAQRTFSFIIKANRPGTTNAYVTLSTARGLTDEATASTDWLAVPGISTSIIDSQDPIQMGETTTYTAKIANQGLFKPVGADMVIRFSPELQPISVSGSVQGTIEGNLVRFPGARIEAGKDIVVRIEVRGAQAGYGDAILEVTPDFMTKTIKSQESTTVY